MDTIFAPATASGRAGVSVIRISGPKSDTVLSSFGAAAVPARVASVRKLFWNGDLIDEALVLFFPKGASFTGEAVLELQLHGSIAIQRKVLECLGSLSGCRFAEAGEFTRRALENGRLDLTQVEGLADLIDAETEAQRRQASQTFQGRFSDQIELWRGQLIRAAALIEATIDFADEEVPVDVTPEVREILTGLVEVFEREQRGVDFAERVRDGFTVAIVGKPNAGKSTLLNFLAGRDVAITSEIAGTTRDIVEVQLEIAGLPVTLLDTAGLRVSEDAIELIGIDRAVKRAQEADLRIFLGPNEHEIAFVEGDIRVRPKIDEPDNASPLGVSGLTGQGVDQLCQYIGTELSSRALDGVSATTLRHRAALARASEILTGVLITLGSDHLFSELIAEDMRHVIREMDGIVGRVGVEDLLGEIFSSFCIGK